MLIKMLLCFQYLFYYIKILTRFKSGGNCRLFRYYNLLFAIFECFLSTYCRLVPTLPKKWQGGGGGGGVGETYLIHI